MIKKHLLVSGIIAIVTFCIAAGIYAKAVPDVIELKDPAYKEHKKGVVHFDIRNTRMIMPSNIRSITKMAAVSVTMIKTASRFPI